MSKQDKKTNEKTVSDKKDPFENCNLTGPGPGRPKGLQNKVTIELKESFKLLAEHNVDKLQDALDRMFADDPDKAVKHFLALAEYVTPKLARTELTGADSGPVTLYLVDRIKDPEAEADKDENDENV